MLKLVSHLLEEKEFRIIGISPEATAKEAAEEMTKERVGAVLVWRDGALKGILTERDIMNKVVATGQDASGVMVHTIMTRDVVVIEPNRTIREAMQIVTEKKLRHLPVVREGQLIGMLSGGDLTRSIVAEDEIYIDTLYEYIRGGYPG